jgi:pyruvate/2-oxoglutarate dehydrogenase complex dihydrolipoamide acyltransferase (E2) component
MRLFEIKMPEMGNVGEVVVVDVLVQANHHVVFEQPLITIETEMATMQIPSPRSGIVHEIKIGAGDKLHAGSLLAVLREPTADDVVVSALVPAKVPVIGDFRNLISLKVIELLVRVGDEVQRGQSLVTLEADEFLVEVPSEYTGIVREMKVKLRDRISPGGVILMIEETQDAA